MRYIKLPLAAFTEHYNVLAIAQSAYYGMYTTRIGFLDPMCHQHIKYVASNGKCCKYIENEHCSVYNWLNLINSFTAILLQFSLKVGTVIVDRWELVTLIFEPFNLFCD